MTQSTSIQPSSAGHAPSVAVRLLVVFPAAEAGGAHSSLLRLVGALERRRFIIEAWLFGGGHFADRLSERGVPVRVWPQRWLRLPWRLKRLRDAIDGGGYDLIYFYGDRLVAQLALALGIPCIERIDKPLDAASGGYGQFPAIDRLTARWSTAIVTPCHCIARQLLERGISKDAVHVIPDWVETAGDAPGDARMRIRRDLNVAATAPLVLSAGRLAPEKAHDDLLLVAARVARRYPETQFLIAGGGPMESEIRRRTRRMRLQKNVRLLGFVDDMPSLYAAADIFLHTARSEGLSNAILEAMSAALPITATRAGGVPEQIDDGRTGLLAEPGDTPAMAEAVCRLIADADLRRQLGRAARTEVASHFRAEPALASYTRLITRLVSDAEAAQQPSGENAGGPSLD